MSAILDLTKTIIDSETGEVIHQGHEGPEIEVLRARHSEGLRAIVRKSVEWRQQQEQRKEDGASKTAA